MRPRVAVLGTLGALATILGVAFVVAPDAVSAAPLRTAIDAISAAGPERVMLAGAAITGMYVIFAARTSGRTRSRRSATPAERAFEAAATDPPETVTDDRRRQTAAALDADFDSAVSHGGPDLQRVRRLLAQTAASAYAHQEDIPREKARQVIETGSWTGDQVAAAFLAGEAGPEPGLYARIRLWLLPETERERRIDRTVAAIQALGEVRE